MTDGRTDGRFDHRRSASGPMYCSMGYRASPHINAACSCMVNMVMLEWKVKGYKLNPPRGMFVITFCLFAFYCLRRFVVGYFFFVWKAFVGQPSSNLHLLMVMMMVVVVVVMVMVHGDGDDDDDGGV